MNFTFNDFNSVVLQERLTRKTNNLDNNNSNNNNSHTCWQILQVKLTRWCHWSDFKFHSHTK